MRYASLLLIVLLALPACRRFTKEGADREVYGLLDRRRPRVPEVQGTLDVEAKTRMAEAIRERRAFELTLRDALELATVASREYRTQRESVYLTTLTLTRELNEFRPLWDVGGSVDYDLDSEGATLDANMSAILSRAFERGGGLVIALANDFLTDITGNPLRIAQSILSADVTFPLLRGAGTLVTLERLRQAERDVLYALRAYALFQQQFTIDIATRFYRALQDRDQWRNAEARYDSLKQLVEEQRSKADAGRIPPFEVDQILQDLLQSDDGRQRRRNAYAASVDRLKLDIGIPVGVDVVLDDSDLETLRQRGPQGAPYELAGALEQAAERRLDLRTARDREADAARRVRVARNALLAGLDLRAGADVDTPREQPFNFREAEARGNLGLDFDLPFERTAERNTYRRAIIESGRARRDRQQTEDLIVFDVRDAFRSLAEAERSYEIQVESARLAERRVESTQLLLEVGRARTRDRLEAETARLTARNAVTASLVDHALARLGLERDVGTLRVDASGWWVPTPPLGRAAGPAPTSPAAPAPDTPADTADVSAPPPAGVPRPAVRKRATIRAAPLPGAARAAPEPGPAPAAEPSPSPARRPGTRSRTGDLPPPAVRPRR